MMQQCRGVWLPSGDTHMRGQIAASKIVAGHPTYQYPKLMKAMEYVRERAVAVDIGAHVGLWTFQLAAMFGKVDAFEPMPVHLECLRRNTAKIPNVRVHPYAIGTRNGEVAMRAVRVNSGESWIMPEAKHGVRVPMRPLDDLQLSGVGLLKIDCEGYEYFGLRGSLDTLARCRPVVVVEQHEASAVRYCIPHLAGRDLLVKHGYVEAAVITVDHVMVPRELMP